jgi:hypothetical protein
LRRSNDASIEPWQTQRPPDNGEDAMAKRGTQVPMPIGGGLGRKVIGLAVVIALLVIVIKHPSGAAAVATGAAKFLGGVIEGLWSFVQQLGG